VGDLLSVGCKVVVVGAQEGVDPYIFQFQQDGVITERVPGGFMVRLNSAVGEWGPVPASKLRADKRSWKPGGWT
jgi:hypothetical protein